MLLTLIAIGVTLQEHVVLLTNRFPEESKLFAGDVPVVQSSSAIFCPLFLSSETQKQTIPPRLLPPDKPPPPWEPQQKRTQ